MQSPILRRMLCVMSIVLVGVVTTACQVSTTNSTAAQSATTTVSASTSTAATSSGAAQPSATISPAVVVTQSSATTSTGVGATQTSATTSTDAGATQTSVTTSTDAGATPSTAASGSQSSGATGSGGAVIAPDSFSTIIRQVAQQVRPAVVQITNQQVQMDQSNQPYTVPAGVGSGVIYDQQGHILTNNHVIEGAQQLLVSLPNGQSFPGKLVGQDPQTDLAVVQISGSNLPVARIGNSRNLQVGDWVVAIGNALALQGGPTVSQGVVSALNRTVQEPGSSSSGSSNSSQGPFLFDVVQTDAPINPGNSGGPLVNLAGEVVGINTLVAGQAEPGVSAQGIGFAIGITTAKPIADQLVATGHAVHPFLGIGYVGITPAIARQIGTTATKGVVVAQVVAGSPAAAAGLQARDVITAVDGKSLETDSDLAYITNSHKQGDTISLTVLRQSQQLTLKATLGTLPNQPNQ